VTSDQVTSEKDDERYIIEATILNVKFKGEYVLLPRIPMILTDMSFEFKRLQYPVQLAFAMTINKALGHRYKCVD
jgi:ATP-dependent DNA helicase PIF1